MVDKSVLRKVYLEKRLTLTNKELERRNKLLLNNFINSFDLNKYHYLHTFLSMAEKKEVDTQSIIEATRNTNPNVQIATSKTLPKGQLEHYALDDQIKVEKNAWGVPQPISGNLIDIDRLEFIIVPLITFDKLGHRIGYGKGYYDRFLKKTPQAIKVGVSLAPPLDKIDYSSEHDVRMDYCVTPFKVYQFQ